MLKIKDNVDLKELEKFGFEITEYYGRMCYTFDYGFYIFLEDYYIHSKGEQPYLFQAKGELLMDGVDYDLNSIPDIVFDLIQAGLVEKV